jgi:hypothetical protein
MTTLICPSCGEDVFTITGWAEVDHCPYCSRPLAIRRIRMPNVERLRREAADDPQDTADAAPDAETSAAAR